MSAIVRQSSGVHVTVPDRTEEIFITIEDDRATCQTHPNSVLIYPGTEIIHPEEDRGIPGPCSTIQLANFRGGLQDHQYLSLARKLGLEGEVQQALQAVVPRLFSEASVTVGFAETGDAYEQARSRLGRAVAAAAGRGLPVK